MERHYIVWTGCLFLITGVVSTLYLGSWFLKYMERTRKESPEKANLVLVLVCIFGICGMALIKVFVPNNDMFGEVLNEVSTVGIVGFSFFGSVSGAIYIARIMLPNRKKKCCEITSMKSMPNPESKEGSSVVMLMLLCLSMVVSVPFIIYFFSRQL